MKTTIIYLGLAVLAFTTVSAANALNAQDLVQQDLAVVTVDSAQQADQLAFVDQGKGGFTMTGEETVIFNPNTVIKSDYMKTMERVVADDKMITEAAEDIFQPIALEMSLEDRIAESNQIIEGHYDAEVYPLDFEKINRMLQNNKPCPNNMAVTIDLKL